MSCLCRYLRPERAAPYGIDVKGKVCLACAIAKGSPALVSFPAEPTTQLYTRTHLTQALCTCSLCEERRTPLRQRYGGAA